MSLPEYTRLRLKLKWIEMRQNATRRIRRFGKLAKRREEQLEFPW
jgi:hypothetical protein